MAITDKFLKRIIPASSGKNAQISQTEIAEDIYQAAHIWYGGSEEELMQLYQRSNATMKFWGCKPSDGEVRRIHSGIPKETVDKLAEISANGFNSITVEEKQQELVDSIMKTNKFRAGLETVARDSILYGFGAWKLYFDKKNELRFKWYTFPEVEFEAENNEVNTVIFKTKIGNGKYVVRERYSQGKIEVELKTLDGSKVSPVAIPKEFWAYKDNECTWTGNFSMAVPVVWTWSTRFKNKPDSIISSKFEKYDFLDEIMSKMNEHMRDGEIKTFWPSTFVLSGQKPNSFDNKFIQHQADMSPNGKNEIVRLSEQLQVEAYENAYYMILEACLEGIISASTLGHDTSKTENAEAQREREKTTIYTRNKVIKMLSESIVQLVQNALCAYYTAHGGYSNNMEHAECSVDFDEYAAPDMDSIITTVAKAVNLMSIEARVEELWGNSKTEEWKQEEIKRLKIEQGLVSGIETQVMDYDE